VKEDESRRVLIGGCFLSAVGAAEVSPVRERWVRGAK
jgi:hypothetical protein